MTSTADDKDYMEPCSTDPPKSRHDTAPRVQELRILPFELRLRSLQVCDVLVDDR